MGKAGGTLEKDDDCRLVYSWGDRKCFIPRPADRRIETKMTALLGSRANRAVSVYKWGWKSDG